MSNITDVPTPRASVIVPADSPLLWFTDNGAIYDGPCPAVSHEEGHLLKIARNAAKCGVCGTEFTARIVRSPGRAPYLQLQF